MSTKSTPQQLAFDLVHRPAFGAEDFLVSQCNEVAIKFIDNWPDWPPHGHALVGPAASGKTHLVDVWRLRANAAIIEASNLTLQSLETLDPKQPVCIENIDRGLSGEEMLFHALNLAKEQQRHLLVTSRQSLGKTSVQLKDLRSRLLAFPEILIAPPDDELLKGVMIKQFMDRQLDVEPELIDYVFARIERSMEAVTRFVEALDQRSLGARRRITKLLAREVLFDH